MATAMGRVLLLDFPVCRFEMHLPVFFLFFLWFSFEGYGIHQNYHSADTLLKVNSPYGKLFKPDETFVGENKEKLALTFGEPKISLSVRS
jgi:hypothetical protein